MIKTCDFVFRDKYANLSTDNKKNKVELMCYTEFYGKTETPDKSIL